MWDTVGALGVPGFGLCSSAFRFHDTGLRPYVRHAFQALAIDERRSNFQPAIWVKSEDDPDQILEQVWFPGAHSNVGGGYLQHGLSDAALLWMASRLLHHQLLDLDAGILREAVYRHHAERPVLGELKNSRKGRWWLIACPIPRPVAITDVSEQIHGVALARSQQASAGDPYASAERRAWLSSFSRDEIWDASAFERNNAFAGSDDGNKPIEIDLPKPRLSDRVCRWLISTLFGSA